MSFVRCLFAVAMAGGLSAASVSADEYRPVPLRSQITAVQPLTGIVLWTTNGQVDTDAIQLEYSYMKYGDVVSTRGEYDWTAVERVLNVVAGRRHQAVLRFYDVYVGQPTTVPAYIKALPDYRETQALSEKKLTGFSDWSHPELQRFVKEFFTRFAERYDADPRLAYVQTGFGLWAEYHIYDGPMQLGRTFPSREFQAEFARHLATVFRQTPWMISVDAAGDHAPFAGNRELLALPFGVFDDSFLCQQHAKENVPNWNALDRERWKVAPTGGEFSYYTKRDQQLALAERGPHGVRFEAAAREFHLTFIIGDGQTGHQPLSRLREAGRALGYKFRVTAFGRSPTASRVTIANTGIAPLYHDAFPAVNGVRVETSLKGLLPGESRTFVIPAGDAAPRLTIESPRLVPGQTIEFEADLD